jgi:hypothetical protein
MYPGKHAATHPETGQVVTYAELEARTNRPWRTCCALAVCAASITTPSSWKTIRATSRPAAPARAAASHGVALLGDEATAGEIIHERLIDRRALELEVVAVSATRPAPTARALPPKPVDQRGPFWTPIWRAPLTVDILQVWN